MTNVISLIVAAVMLMTVGTPYVRLEDEKFANTMLRIMTSYDEYEGKTALLSGYVAREGDGEPFFVGRDYNCCSDGASRYGFLCVYEGEPPEDGSWVEVYGIIGKYDGKISLDVIYMRSVPEGNREVKS